MPDALFDRLVSFRIDPPGVALSFAQRLAHENGWSLAFAQRAIAEYFRFVWLAMRAGHPVTPSPAVDEVWHLHLCYTQSYWEDLCAKVLPRPLHHGPTRGGAGEDAKYADWYARTLASYREHFGEPPADLWPLPSERFRGGIPRKVDARSHWVVPKARVRSLLAVGARVAAVAAVLLLTVGCVDLSKPDSVMTLGITIVGGVFLFGIVMMVVFVRIAQRANRANPRRRADANSGCGGAGGCGFPVGGLGLHGHGHAHGHGSGLPPVLPVHDGHGHGVHGHGAHGHGGDHDHGHNGHGDGHGHGDGQGHGGDAGSSGGGDSGGGGGDSGGSSGCGGGGGGCGGGGD